MSLAQLGRAPRARTRARSARCSPRGSGRRSTSCYLWFAGEEARARVPRTTATRFYRSIRRCDAARASACCAARCCTTSRSTSSGSACCSSASARPRASLDVHHHTMGAAEAARSRCCRPRCGCRCCAPARASRRSCAASRGASAARPRCRSCSSRRAFPRSLRYCVRSALALSRRLDAVTGGKGAVTAGAHRGWRRSIAGWTPRKRRTSRCRSTRC